MPTLRKHNMLLRNSIVRQHLGRIFQFIPAAAYIRSGLALYPSVVGNPIQLPGLSVVIRKGLFKMASVFICTSNNELHQDRSAIGCVHPEELTTTVLEFAKDWCG